MFMPLTQFKCFFTKMFAWKESQENISLLLSTVPNNNKTFFLVEFLTKPN
jgi:hypothetical protein